MKQGVLKRNIQTNISFVLKTNEKINSKYARVAGWIYSRA